MSCSEFCRMTRFNVVLGTLTQVVLAPIVLVLLALVPLVPLAAADEAPPDQDLAEMAIAAKTEFRPVTSQDLEAGKSGVLQAMEDLEDYWSSEAAEPEAAAQPTPAETAPEEASTEEASTDEIDDSVAGWREYLQWDAFRKEMEKQSPGLRELAGFRDLYFRSRSGLERPAYREVRDALTAYMNVLFANSQPKPKEMYEARLDDLAQRLRAFPSNPNQSDAVAMARTLGWLEQMGQADALVKAVRDRYRQPNLMAHLSKRIMAAGFSDEVNEDQTVRDNILGTSIRSTATMTGDIDVELVPDDDRATLDILLKGNAHSRNVGYNGPVTIYSTGNTSISASKRVHIDASGFESLGAVARCCTSSHVSCIAARCRLVRRIARNRAARSKTQAERIASSHSAWRVQRQFDEKAGEMLDEANENFADQFEKPLLRRDSFPNDFRFRTTEDSLEVKLMRAGSFQLSASGTPPELSGDHDMAIRLHESLVSNFSETLIGGETLTDEQLVKLFEDAELEVPEELKIGPEKDPWSISFSPDEPVRVQFSDSHVTVHIKGRQFSRGDQVVRATIQISANYKLEMGETGPKVTRQGGVEVEYVNQSRLGVTQLAMKTFIRRKFESLFEKDLSGEGLFLPGRWKSAGRLVAQQLDSENGWLTVGWASDPEDVPTPEDESAPAGDQVAAMETSG